MLGGGVDHLAVGLDGLVDVSEPKLVDAAQAVPELRDLVGALADLGLPREDVGELAPALGLAEEPIEGANGDLVLPVDLEHLAIPRDGVVHVLELNLVDLRDAQPQLDEALRLIVEL